LPVTVFGVIVVSSNSNRTVAISRAKIGCRKPIFSPYEHSNARFVQLKAKNPSFCKKRITLTPLLIVIRRKVHIFALTYIVWNSETTQYHHRKIQRTRTGSSRS
jgi:hypothetical protein